MIVVPSSLIGKPLHNYHIPTLPTLATDTLILLKLLPHLEDGLSMWISIFFLRVSPKSLVLSLSFFYSQLSPLAPLLSPLFSFVRPFPAFRSSPDFFHAQRASRTNPHVPKFLGFPKGNLRTSGRAFWTLFRPSEAFLTLGMVAEAVQAVQTHGNRAGTFGCP